MSLIHFLFLSAFSCIFFLYFANCSCRMWTLCVQLLFRIRFRFRMFSLRSLIFKLIIRRVCYQRRLGARSAAIRHVIESLPPIRVCIGARLGL